MLKNQHPSLPYLWKTGQRKQFRMHQRQKDVNHKRESKREDKVRKFSICLTESQRRGKRTEQR